MNVELIDNIPESSKVKLKRAFGKSVKNVDFDTLVAFYSAYPFESKSQRTEENAFFSVTMQCHYQEMWKSGVPFTDAISTYYNKCTDSGKTEVSHLMNAAYDSQGTFIKRMASLIRKMESKGIYINAEDLFKELNLWNYSTKRRNESIVKNILGIKENENDN